MEKDEKNTIYYSKLDKVLTPVEKYIYLKRCNNSEYKPTLRQLAKELNISHETVRRIENRAYYKINKRSKTNAVFGLSTGSKVELEMNKKPKMVMKNGVLRVEQTQYERYDEIQKAYKKLKK